MTKELKKLQGKAPFSPKTCPVCGCQCFDPFNGKILIHDVEKCSEILKSVELKESRQKWNTEV
jgi:RNA polymerase subunit RPABC4/transcription elongation factor Spt4